MKEVLVVGGGIAGIQASLDLAAQGIKVSLVEQQSSIGGKMSQLDKTFPTLDCSSCILTPKMVDVARDPNIDLMVYSEVVNIEGQVGNFKVTIKKKPKYVVDEPCTGCMICVNKCPYRAPSEFNEGIGKRKAISVPFPQAVPLVPVIDPSACAYFQKDGACRACEKYCPTDAIKFDQTEEFVERTVASIIYATGFKLYDPSTNHDYGYGVHEDVITSLELERFLSSTGPTEGHLRRFSDDTIPEKVAIILCVGSRSQLTNYYCSRFCCMASIKQAILIKDHHPSTEITIFYMDIRAFGKGFQEFYYRAEFEYGVNFVKGKVGRVDHLSDSNRLKLKYENVDRGAIEYDTFDMVVLAVGAEPPKMNGGYPIPLLTEDDGFVGVNNAHLDPVSTSVDGIFVAGMLEGPKDIPDSVIQAGAAAMKAASIARRD